MNATLQRLRAEIRSDQLMWLARTDELRKLDLTQAGPAVLAQAAVALHHGYGAIESALERITRTLEGSLPSGRDWHVALLESMSLDIEGVRPKLLSQKSLSILRRLLAFRHFFRHAYAVTLEQDKLEMLRADMLELRVVLAADLDEFDRHLAQAAAQSV